MAFHKTEFEQYTSICHENNSSSPDKPESSEETRMSRNSSETENQVDTSSKTKWNMEPILSSVGESSTKYKSFIKQNYVCIDSNTMTNNNRKRLISAYFKENSDNKDNLLRSYFTAQKRWQSFEKFIFAYDKSYSEDYIEHILGKKGYFNLVTQYFTSDLLKFVECDLDLPLHGLLCFLGCAKTFEVFNIHLRKSPKSFLKMVLWILERPWIIPNTRKIDRHSLQECIAHCFIYLISHPELDLNIAHMKKSPLYPSLFYKKIKINLEYRHEDMSMLCLDPIILTNFYLKNEPDFSIKYGLFICELDDSKFNKLTYFPKMFLLTSTFDSKHLPQMTFQIKNCVYKPISAYIQPYDVKSTDKISTYLRIHHIKEGKYLVERYDHGYPCEKEQKFREREFVYQTIFMKMDV